MPILHAIKEANTEKSDREVNPINILSLESIVQSPKTTSKRQKYFFFYFEEAVFNSLYYSSEARWQVKFLKV